MKVLNLYACLGGNRYKWDEVANIEVTAVELDEEAARLYQERFPNDKVIVADAHQYLLEHYKEFDFIWSSPPCQSHSSFRQNICVRFRGTRPIYPDMKLYQEIIFLEHNPCKAKWVIENVCPYYVPLIKERIKLQRHHIWSNFEIAPIKLKPDNIRSQQILGLQLWYGFALDKYKLKNKRQFLRNCVTPELGKHILNMAFNLRNKINFAETE